MRSTTLTRNTAGNCLTGADSAISPTHSLLHSKANSTMPTTQTDDTDTTDAEPTPGPWELDEIAPSGLMKPIFVESGDATICAMAAFLEPNSHVNPKEALANARLIAAAPEMLKALKLCKHQIQEIASQAGHDPGVYKAYTMVEDAIAKAEGEA